MRTAIGTYGGTLINTPALELGATAMRETIKRCGLAAEKIETAVMGHVVQAGAKMNPARQAVIGAGMPVAVPALTVTFASAIHLLNLVNRDRSQHRERELVALGAAMSRTV